MTKKDYILIAEVLKKYTNAMSKVDYKVTGYALVDEIILALADKLQAQNPRFDSERFLTACDYRVWQLNTNNK